MLFVLFHLGAERYALDTRRIVEVVPLSGLRKIPHAPKGVAGLFNYRGQPVPVVDLCELTLNQPAGEQLSTRIIVVNHPDAEGNERLLGLIAERATDLLRRDAADFADSHLRIGAAPYLGPVTMDKRGVVQWIHEQRLLPDSTRDLLFSEMARLSPAQPPRAAST